MNEFEYHILDADYNENYPTINPEKGEDVDFYYQGIRIENPDPVRMCLAEPIPDSPIMVDYHMTTRIFSTKFKLVIERFKIDYIQFIPAIIRGINNQIYQDYWLLNICKRIKCLDLEKSEYRTLTARGTVKNLNKIVLDVAKLREFKLQDRLFFELGETYNHMLIHKSIVDEIINSEIVGVKIYNLEEYYRGIQFE